MASTRGGFPFFQKLGPINRKKIKILPRLTPTPGFPEQKALPQSHSASGFFPRPPIGAIPRSCKSRVTSRRPRRAATEPSCAGSLRYRCRPTQLGLPRRCQGL